MMPSTASFCFAPVGPDSLAQRAEVGRLDHGQRHHRVAMAARLQVADHVAVLAVGSA
jgi:hypothetical protein